MGSREPTFLGLSRLEYQVLNLLVSSGRELYGLEMVGMSDSVLKRGTIYVTLGRMQDKGYIASRLEDTARRARSDGMLPRRLYKPTGVGRRAYFALSSIAQDATLAAT